MGAPTRTRRDFLKAAGLGLMSLALPKGLAAAAGGAGKRRNIIVIMSDEHNASITGCYGNAIVSTPNLNSLAANGVTFDACYCNSPLCVPSRLAFTAGKYVSRIGAWNNSCWLPSADYPSLPRLLNAAGYESFLCGKMHYDKTRRYGFTEIGGNMNSSNKTGGGSRRKADDLAPKPGHTNRFDAFHPGDDSSILSHDLEPVKPVECPLDVLAQVIISMVGLEPWDMDELYAFLKTSTPYRYLNRNQFDSVLNMLGGRYAGTRIRELRPRISIDRLDNSIAAKKGALLSLYMSGGTIPDRGYFHLRHEETGGLIGELDEEFVWEAAVGETFTLGTQHWRIERITHNDVLVRPAMAKVRSTPFWKGEVINRDFHFSSRIYVGVIQCSI